MNTLADRIKAINKELTALKTAHKRGLGNLRIYSKEVEIDPTGHGSGFFFLEFTVNFDDRFGAYPFAYVNGRQPEDDSGAPGVMAFTYTNNGYSLKSSLVYTVSSLSAKLNIISTSPVKSVSYRWL